RTKGKIPRARHTGRGRHRPRELRPHGPGAGEGARRAGGGPGLTRPQSSFHDGAEAIAGLPHLLIRVDAPDFVAAEPAFYFRGPDAAPSAAAFEEFRDHTRFGARHNVRRRIGRAPERAHRAAHDNAATPREHALVHPAFGALPVADLAPDVGLADH